MLPRLGFHVAFACARARPPRDSKISWPGGRIKHLTLANLGRVARRRPLRDTLRLTRQTGLALLDKVSLKGRGMGGDYDSVNPAECLRGSGMFALSVLALASPVKLP